MGGRVVKSGGFELAEQLEAEGYAGLAKELGLAEEELAAVEEPEKVRSMTVI